MPFRDLLPQNGEWKNDITRYLSEDVPAFDVGGFVVGRDPKTATLNCKQSGVLAGVPFADEIFRQCSVIVEWLVEEGSYVEVPKGGKVPVAKVSGPARDILLAERTALNILARASGIASR